MIPNDATQAQIDAANPVQSTWLSANAGSGKTRVLTDRVARLLLGGVSPRSILCLTYTKAAASEMQNRLFKRLGAWSMMDDLTLTQSLRDLGCDDTMLDIGTLATARRLFAQAIETPGGLKIQTIHSFCAALLCRFPLEAGVSPAFTELDDRGARTLRADVLEDLAADSPDIMTRFAQYFTGEDPDDLLAEIVKRRDLFAADLTDDALHDKFDLTSADTEVGILADVFLGNEQSIIDAVLPFLLRGGVSDQKLHPVLFELDFNAPSLSLLADLEKAFLTQSGQAAFQPKAKSPTKAVKEALPPETLAQFDLFRQRVADVRQRRLALTALRKTKALHDLAAAFLPRLDQAKSKAGLLDFDDLIARARQLLSASDVAAWVLYRLDGGIDHLLVDEAQDTSPEQWAVITQLAAEFTAGQGARDKQRTIFVVGDPKQSIYSFQGADPAAFGQMRDHFQGALTAIDDTLHKRELLHSFRSAKPILDLVDHTFAGDATRGMGERVKHRAFQSNLPGRVDLWNWIDIEDDPEDPDWWKPVDQISNTHHNAKLAGKIAAFIADRLDHGQITTDDGDGQITRAIRPGDFLILVQGRQGIFNPIITACKARGLPMAGADVLKIGAELGVRDLTALLGYLATPEDDLALATILRSPLCGISQDELHKLCHDRPTYLRAAFEARKDDFADAYAMLKDLRDKSDYMRPYDLLERCLTRHKGREKLVARLGAESEEGIAALLDQAQNFERGNIPSLTAFLAWLESDEVKIKRQLDSGQNQIRVMTVHGAKGLEAPIVILPETATKQNRLRDDVLNADGTAVWKMNATDMPDMQEALVDAQKGKQSQERMRLLYVAMTRAKNWLVICGSGKRGNDDSDAWYAHAERALQETGAQGTGDVLWRVDNGGWPGDVAQNDVAEEKPRTPLDVPTTPVTHVIRPIKPRAPSDLGGDKVVKNAQHVATTDDDAMARGTMIHRLLEHLPAMPRDMWAAASANLMQGHVPQPGDDLLAVAMRILDTPNLAHIFASDTLAEVGIVADINGVKVAGNIDRLVVTPDKVTAIDFKSNAIVPDSAADTPEGILRQMGAYAAALGQVYPDRQIEVAILWTTTATLMSLPHDIVTQALSRTIYLDADRPGS